MAIDPSGGGWGLGQLGAPSQSTQQLTPTQVQNIQHTVAAMQQQPAQASQQNAMMNGMFGSNNNFGQNLGSMTQAFVGGPAYGGGNIFTDAYGGNAAAPLPGLNAGDYG